jgi:hypothetical protein
VPHEFETSAAEPSPDLVCVARFFDSATAHIARSVLDSEGLFACLDTEATNTMLPHFGTALGGVKLLVMEDQADKAKAILAAHSAADFEQPVDSDEEDLAADEDEEDSSGQSQRDGHIRRAWTAAILGIVLCPPLMSIYSFYLLVRHGLLVNDQHARPDWRVNAALVVNLLVIALTAIGVRVLLSN